MKNKAVVFDLDGTLWDATKVVTEVWNLQNSRNPDMQCPITEEQFQKLQGMTGLQIMKTMLPHLKESRQIELMHERSRLNEEYMKNAEIPLYPGVVRTLQAMKKEYALFLVSNCSPYYLQVLLDRPDTAGLFDDAECSGRTGKPKGENIRDILSRNGVETAVYVGDTTWDKEAAEQAGIPFIHAAYGFQKVKADYALANFTQLPDTVREIIG